MKQISDESIRQAMQQAFPAADARVSLFYEMQEYHLGWRDAQLAPTHADRGKLLRPRFCLLACAAVGGNPEQAEPLAAAIQLLHDFSLIHDDIEDHSPTRRGRETVWKLWDVPQAINVGDGMFTLAQLSLFRLSDVGVEASVVVEIARRFNQTIIRLCEGQYLDMSFEQRLDISEADYLAMISRKTAALIAAAAGLGAILGNANREQASALYNWGEALGLAFQIEDDMLGIWGAEAVTGKPDAHDIWGRKKSLPIIHALAHADADDGKTLAAIYQKAELEASDIPTVLAILERTGSQGYTAGVAKFYHEQALAALADLQGEAEPIAELHGLTKQLLGRVK
ncbi:polyprenyl synthetase family protein [Herpetosiphon giganteus]|uniref:polyprenyl synthetase family protein n=1 Tax=Herpetosiphon giganteus TaxID=2029754 RepID=UPI0019577A51|nr:polyprenyl synthetase family protein [Herpetosiphon giganteus]MBM7846713.1 geranylgeranyl diphosphate synthase type I [Herpetosiphon giganteus]